MPNKATALLKDAILKAAETAGLASASDSHDDLRAVPELVGPVDHDAVARLQPRKHLDAVTVGHPQLDRAHRYGAVVIDVTPGRAIQIVRDLVCRLCGARSDQRNFGEREESMQSKAAHILVSI